MERKKERITQVKKDAQGRLVEFKTNTGKVYDFDLYVDYN